MIKSEKKTYKAGAVIDICEIDTQIQRIYRYNGKWDLQAHGRGGTILDDAVDYINNHRRKHHACNNEGSMLLFMF